MFRQAQHDTRCCGLIRLCACPPTGGFAESASAITISFYVLMAPEYSGQATLA